MGYEEIKNGYTKIREIGLGYGWLSLGIRMHQRGEQVLMSLNE